MPDPQVDSKSEVETLSIDAARPILGDLVNRADYIGTPTVLTRYGKAVAAIVPIRDLDRLRELDAPAISEV